jgi:hypothetical protein
MRARLPEQLAGDRRKIRERDTLQGYTQRPSGAGGEASRFSAPPHAAASIPAISAAVGLVIAILQLTGIIRRCEPLRAVWSGRDLRLFNALRSAAIVSEEDA